jgi:hypothetical protein
MPREFAVSKKWWVRHIPDVKPDYVVRQRKAKSVVL